MRWLVAVVLAVAAVLSLYADAPKPNTLTPQEIAEGWLLLFDGTSTFGWTVDSKVQVKDGTLALGAGGPSSIATTTTFSFYTLRVEFRTPPDDAAIMLNGQRWKFANWHDGRWEQFVDANGWIASQWTLRPGMGDLSHGLGGSYGTGAKAGRFGAGSNLTGDSGPIAFTAPGDKPLSLRSIKVKPLTLQSIFNGKDLTGWKVHPGRNSTFSVTPEGWLNVKDGPGDLQSEGQWSNFMLQIECLSHGKHLNSGIFYRCRPNEYQQGYEAQIRNQFTDEPKQEYTIEEYDPTTHRLVNQRRIKSPAVDYGTGAIYRRMPARRQMSKDGEWFTMSVSARERHFAVWVNGVQVTDWSDNRPDADNARKGYYSARGPISIQGHDPTTNLSFRNLRIAELPRCPPSK
jgi:hypothetical protein